MFFVKTCIRNGIVLVLPIVSVAQHSMGCAFRAVLSPIASKMKRYGVDKSPVGAFKATRQNSQIPQTQAPLRAFVDATEKDGLVTVIVQ